MDRADNRKNLQDLKIKGKAYSNPMCIFKILSFKVSVKRRGFQTRIIAFIAYFLNINNLL